MKWFLARNKINHTTCKSMVEAEKWLNCLRSTSCALGKMWNVYCFEQPINVLEKATVVFNTGALVFFTMTCVLRFYLIVIRQPLPYEDTFMRPRYISALTLLGFLFTAFLVVLSWGGQYSYSRSGH